MTDQTRIRLDSFCDKRADIQRERLDNLIADIEGPLRVYWKTSARGDRVRYLGVRTWPQYFKEFFFTHIVCMPEKIAAIKEKTRKAIEQKIEPHLRVAPDVNNAIQNVTHAIELMDKLYIRVYNDRVGDDYFQQKKDCEIDTLKIGKDEVATTSIRPGRCLTVPKGVWIARSTPAKINADVYILARPGASDYGQTDEGNDKHRESKLGRDGAVMPYQKENTYLDLAAHYESLLTEQATGNKTVVLQLLSNASLHWFVAYTVSKEFIKSAGRNKPSIMLVPPDSDQDPSNQGLRKLSDKEWMQERMKNLTHPEGLLPYRAADDDHREDVKPCTASCTSQGKTSPPEIEIINLEISDDENELVGS